MSSVRSLPVNPSLLPLLLLFVPSCAYKHKQADLLVHNAHIITLDSAEHLYQAMAVKDGRIIELGPEQQIRNEYNAAVTFDAAGQWIYPGFIDGHCHFLGYGLNRQKVDLSGTESWSEVVERTRRFAAAHPEKEWIVGRGWDQNDWGTKEYPTNAELNALFPDRPVLLQRIDGHAAIVNDAALKKSGLDVTRQIAGGQMLLRDGKFTGVLVDNAVDVFQTIFDDADEATKRQALLDAQGDCLAAGLTMVCDAGLDANTIDLIQRMHQEGTLKIRVYAMVADEPENLARFEGSGPIITDRLVVRCVKAYADGALGSRGALLKRPYDDAPGHYGLQLRTREHLDRVAAWCGEHGFQMATHCIGDSANKLMLDVYGEALGGTNDLRWRIEHVQCMDPADLPLFARYNVIPSMQPTHLASDAPWAVDRIGMHRFASAYAWNAALEQNGLIALGTDFPVEGISPIATFNASIGRKQHDGSPIPGGPADEALSRTEALRGMTIWNAIATFTEQDLGSLEVGKRADFVVLDRDILSVREDLLPGTRVSATFVNGERLDR